MSQKIRACYFCYYCMYTNSNYVSKINHLYTLITWYVLKLTIFWLCTWLGLWCVCSCFLKHEPLVRVHVTSHILSACYKCGGQNSQTIRVYAHKYNMTTSVSSVSSHQMLSAVLLCLQYNMNFSTHFIFICESWHMDTIFFSNKWIN